MKNAHLRFGWLAYTKKTEKTTTSFKLRVDRFIGEVLSNVREAKAHLISVIGGDTQISAISAAISMGERFRIEGPGLDPIHVCLDRNAQCFKGSVQLPGRKKPLRHLIGVSEDFSTASSSANTPRALLADGETDFVWASLARIHGLPGIPDWSAWFCRELERRRLITPLLGIGCSPVLVKGSKEQFLSWLGRGVQRGDIAFPGETGPIEWSHSTLGHIFRCLPN